MSTQMILWSVLVLNVLLHVEAARGEFRAGAGRRVITPDPLLPVSGGLGPTVPVREKRGELTARAVAFQNKETTLAVAKAPRIVIDGRFDDWTGIRSFHDPAGDTHDTDHKERDDMPDPVEHPDADLVEYKVAHDDENLYFYFRSRGQIARTQRAGGDKPAGRFYAIVTIDVDDNEDTGYWLHEGGYYPTSRGYDVNAEIEFFDGEFNTACYLNHGAVNERELQQAFLDQSLGKYRAGHDGPYAAGFLRVLPGTYKQYTQWVPHQDGTLTFVVDKGPVVKGLARAAVAPEGDRLEACFPLQGFLKDEQGRAIIATGRKLNLSFSLESSGELAPGRKWASDTGAPIRGYMLTPRVPPAPQPKKP